MPTRIKKERRKNKSEKKGRLIRITIEGTTVRTEEDQRLYNFFSNFTNTHEFIVEIKE